MTKRILPTINGVQYEWSEAIGVALGLVIGGLLSALIGAWFIHLVLGWIGVGALTFKQVFGLLLVWEYIKPRTESK
jgi:hypothetical protein